MSTINKVPASAGAEWLLAGFALLRKAPIALGLLPIVWGLASTLLVVLVAMTGVTALFYAAQFVLVLAGPLFFAAMVWAVREVDAGRPVHPRDLLQPIRDGHARALIATLLPQIVASLALGLLLLLMIGMDEINHLLEVFEKLQAIAAAGGQADPALIASLPAGRLLLWLLLVVVTFVAIKWMTFIAAPQILFSGADAFTAMADSLRACLRNWSAMLVFYLLTGLTIFAVTFASLIVAAVLQLVAGPTVAVTIWQLGLLAVLTPVLAGAMLAAWRQMMRPAGEPNASGGPAGPATTAQIEA
ncbi:BPSS1780 family membrane protein [Pseudoxanthomonas indica]|uniref:Membrane domain of glycerophosphoryl diester phosphodiesterase n=1 Tax=Pseudoxanthomonas indica TaxID=428993 RepID=A0A1T5KRH2_9GAMM|nr:BPSS1780 family membrane protein [Pseudoxanthomonas indica]GGD51094.1 hypothetical protein GCM10007235_24090 [Pseudoxanthomonas indica]SKC66356.1 hypothetical protein SAMN06296058_1956 [Pseudoxanthomonas indica]